MGMCSSLKNLLKELFLSQKKIIKIGRWEKTSEDDGTDSSEGFIYSGTDSRYTWTYIYRYINISPKS